MVKNININIKRQYLASVIVMLVLLSFSVLIVAGLGFIKNKSTSSLNVEDELLRLVNNDSSILSAEKLSNANSSYGVYSMIKTEDGDYLFLKVLAGELINGSFKSSVLFSLPNGDLITQDNENYLSEIILRDGSRTSAITIKPMVTFIRTESDELLPIDVSNGKVDDGVLNGIFSGRSLESGYQLAGEIVDHNIDSAYVAVSPAYVSPLIKTLSEILKIEVIDQKRPNEKVLGTHTNGFEGNGSVVNIEGRLVTKDKGKSTYRISGVEEASVDLSTIKKLVETSVITTIVNTVSGNISEIQPGLININNSSSIPFVLTANSVGSTEIKDLSILGQDIALGTITADKLASNIEFTPSDGSVGLSKLSIANSAIDEACLTYESSTNNFEWQSCGTDSGGTITGVTAGSGLTGGGTTGNVSLSLNSSQSLTDLVLSSSLAPITFSNAGFANCSALETNAFGELECGVDDGGAGGGIATLQVDDVNTVTSATVLDFLGSDFNLTNSPAGEGNLSIDYTNSKIVRSDQNETITGSWTITATDLSCTDCIGSNEISGLTWAEISGTPTTLSGYGITDALTNATSSTQAGYFGDIYLYDDTTPSHYLQITNAQNLTGAHVLSISTQDADRSLTISGNATLSGTNTGDQTITLEGDVTGTGTGTFTTTLGNDKVLESHLKAVNSPTDEYCLTYEETTGDFEWQTCGGSESNSFTTIAVSNGTNPVATSSTDTLTLADCSYPRNIHLKLRT